MDAAAPALYGLAPFVRGDRRGPGAAGHPGAALIATLIAFFLAVGLSAHALDELRGRPLQTRIPSAALIAVAAAGLAGAVALGVVGITRAGWGLLPFMVVGPVLVIAYNAELFGGIIHTDLGFAAAWGAFPVLVAYAAQTGGLALAPVLAAAGALALSAAQRFLSTPARMHPAPDRAGGRHRDAGDRRDDADRLGDAAGAAGACAPRDVLGHRAARGIARGRPARLAVRRLTRYRGGHAGGHSASLRCR